MESGEVGSESGFFTALQRAYITLYQRGEKRVPTSLPQPLFLAWNLMEMTANVF